MNERIKQLMLDFVAINTDTGTESERDVQPFFQKWFDGMPYFNQNPGHCGFFPIPNDRLGRVVPWAMVKGCGNDTVVLIHHCDTVDTEDYKHLRHLALSPDNITKAFGDGQMDMPQAALDDLNSGNWLFGRGVADMKGGGAVHMALLEQYAAEADFAGNVILLSVPDEENLSAGMIGAVELLKQLTDKFGLKIVLTMDIEAHEREQAEQAIFHDGSIGKVMPVVYARGKLAHTGMIFKGLNPINLLAEIVRQTELGYDFMERYGNAVIPPPTWLYHKDSKQVYNVSLPDAALGYMSVLTASKSPKEIMEMVHEAATAAFDIVIHGMNHSYARFLELNGMPYQDLPWQTNVKYFDEVYKQAMADSGEGFITAFKELEADIAARYHKKEIDMISGINEIITFTLLHVADQSPIVVLAMSPPFYPAVNNAMLGDASAKVNGVLADTCTFTKDELGLDALVKNIYTGISDLSYSMFVSGNDVIDYMDNNMLMGDVYSMRLDLIKELSAPVLNIGPWGKDIHKYTERVYLPDLYRNTPMVTDFIIRKILGGIN
ncbi:MAG: M20/M25/M40 family metallo-hydrolase [Defluviitaleaceae bacterium]|nr:M20/M25/M40 family metallo-hydrolase [Defluviitaleaceae bacterium]